MNTPNKILLMAFLLIILVVIVFKFDQFFINKDYIVHVNADCDPVTQSCFQMDCDGLDESECDTTTYKKLELPARNAPECLLERECLNYGCSSYDTECVELYCEQVDLEEGEVCVGSGM